MEKKRKVVLIISIALVSILLLLSVTYAAMKYMDTGTTQELIMGDIWMKYEELSELTIEDAMPGADYTNYFEFAISGKNTYTKKDIYYRFILNRGTVPEDKDEEYRIPDEYLMFKLVSVDEYDDETILLANIRYDDIEDIEIYEELIEKNTEDVINRRYRLYVAIDESLEIGNLDTAVFTFDEWEQAFASVKVNVTGDFNSGDIEGGDDYDDNESSGCFDIERTSFYIRNEDLTEEELEYCKIYFENLVNDEDSDYSFADGTTSATFCQGTGKIMENWNNKYIYNFQDYLNKSYDSGINRLISNNVVFEETGIEIYNYDETCGSDVVIPEYIDDQKVLRLSGFGYKDLTSVEIPNGVRSIEPEAFTSNYLTEVTIPSSVYYVDFFSFNYNEITDLTIEDGVRVIGDAAFSDNQLTEVRLPESIELYYCESFGEATFDDSLDVLVCTDSSDNVTYSGGNG